MAKNRNLLLSQGVKKVSGNENVKNVKIVTLTKTFINVK